MIHFAAFIDVEEVCKKVKNVYQQNNYENTVKLINLCMKYNLKNIIFSSTAAVYGNNKIGVVSEKSKLNH